MGGTGAKADCPRLGSSSSQLYGPNWVVGEGPLRIFDGRKLAVRPPYLGGDGPAMAFTLAVRFAVFLWPDGTAAHSP